MNVIFRRVPISIHLLPKVVCSLVSLPHLLNMNVHSSPNGPGLGLAEAMKEPAAKPVELARELGISIPTLNNYVSETGELRPSGLKVIRERVESFPPVIFNSKQPHFNFRNLPVKFPNLHLDVKCNFLHSLSGRCFCGKSVPIQIYLVNREWLCCLDFWRFDKNRVLSVQSLTTHNI